MAALFFAWYRPAEVRRAVGEAISRNDLEAVQRILDKPSSQNQRVVRDLLDSGASYRNAVGLLMAARWRDGKDSTVDVPHGQLMRWSSSSDSSLVSAVLHYAHAAGDMQAFETAFSNALRGDDGPARVGLFFVQDELISRSTIETTLRSVIGDRSRTPYIRGRCAVVLAKVNSNGFVVFVPGLEPDLLPAVVPAILHIKVPVLRKACIEKLLKRSDVALKVKEELRKI